MRFTPGFFFILFYNISERLKSPKCNLFKKEKVLQLAKRNP